MYTLRVYFLTGNQLPIREVGLFHVGIGPYLLKSKQYEINGNGSIFFVEDFLEKKVNMPLDIKQIPDIIIYFCSEDKEEKRMSFCRVKAKDVLVKSGESQDLKFRMFELKEDKSLDLIGDHETTGFLHASIQLFSCSPDSQIDDRYQVELKDYQLRVHLYMARNIDPVDKEGSSNPFFKIVCGETPATSHCKQCTLNPGYFQTIIMDVQLPILIYQPKDQSKILIKNAIPWGMSLLCYD